jgi:uncharacterized protein (DUF433 family)
VMNGEPFCYGTRLTVRNLLEMRERGIGPAGIIADNPELRLVGIAEAYLFAAQNRARYAEFFTPDGAIRGPAFTAEEAAPFPEHLKVPGIVVTMEAGAPTVELGVETPA